MNILDENGESYFVTAFDHSTQEQGTATSKDAFTGGDINASLTQEVVELREEVAGHGTDQLLYLAGKDSGLVSNDLVDIAVFQDPGIERITLACDTVVEGNDTLLEALYHCQIRMAAAQLQDIDGKAANVNDIGDGMSFQRAELGNGSRKRLGIAEYLADPNRVVLAVILKIHDLAPTQEVLLETAVQLLIVCGRQTHKQGKRRSMFKGILRCGECGRSMYLRNKSNRGYYYYCTLHENYNATICPKKAVKQEDVESLALRLIQTQIRAFSDAQRLIANLNATPSSQTRYQIYETQIDDAKRKIEKFNQLKAALYGDFADGLLSHQDYTDLSEDYSRRADDLRIFIAELEKEKEKYSAGFGSKMQWALLIEKYKDQESLDAEMAAAFIETLTLFSDGHVELAFRHRDEIEQVLYVAATRGKEAERYAG